MPHLTVTNLRAQEIERKAKKKIYDGNRRFAKLSPEKKRVRIAKDVIKQVEIKRFIALNQVYLIAEDTTRWDDSWSRFNSGHSFGNVYDKPVKVNEIIAGKKCQVCAMGAMFVCGVDRLNSVTTADMTSTNKGSFMRDYLTSYFSDEQLALIEMCFEGTSIGLDIDKHVRQRVLHANCNPHYYNDYRNGKKAYFNAHEEWFYHYLNTETRLLEIMKNIIANNGTFSPPMSFTHEH